MDSGKEDIAMTRQCIICDRVFGCVKESFKYACSDCRLVDDCGMRQYFTTTHAVYDICPSCSEAAVTGESRSAREQIERFVGEGIRSRFFEGEL
jgi:hypothetical protein